VSAGKQRVTVRKWGFSVSFELPVGWKFGSSKALLEGRAPGNAAYLRVQNATTAMSLAAVAHGFAASELKTLRKLDPRASIATKNVRIGAGSAVRVTMRYRGIWVNREREITQVVYFLKHGKRAYEFDFGAADATSKDEALFAALANSVRLLGAGPSA
jgi:hypothetical protein